MAEYQPFNPETDEEYNARGGRVIVPGSKAQREYQKWEQFQTKWTAGGEPGNPYVYRHFPMMLYKAERKDGNVSCMLPQPNPMDFANPAEFNRVSENVDRFNRDCQKIVNSEQEMQKEMEAGWRESPQEAIDYVHSVETDRATATAHREYEDRNLSDAAKREVAAIKTEAGGEHQPEIKEVKKRACSKCGETGHNARSCKA